MKISLKNTINIYGFFLSSLIFIMGIVTALVYDNIVLSIFVIFTSFLTGAFTVYLHKRISRSLKNLETSIFKLSRGELSRSLDTKKLNCSEIKKCGLTDCPMYEKTDNCCFLEVGSYAPIIKNEIKCPSIIKGKYKDCRECGIMKVISPDELTFLEVLLDYFRKRIRSVLNTTKNLVSNLSFSTAEISKAAANLAESSQNQASSAEQISATIEEANAAIENIAETSSEQYSKVLQLIDKMNNLSEKIKLLGEKSIETIAATEKISLDVMTGEESMSYMNDSMEKIKTSSTEITSVIKMINDISDKINLLSLNASIEAARAGEAGRGFAVVADEVSKLADQTANSIKDISVLIRANEEEITKGSINVKSTIDSLSKIINSVNMISEMITTIEESMQQQLVINNDVNAEAGSIKSRSNDIKIATEEQKQAFGEISKSIANINDQTQLNASNSEELSSSSEELTGMAETVNNELDFFDF